MLHVSPLSPERVWAMRASGVFMGLEIFSHTRETASQWDPGNRLMQEYDVALKLLLQGPAKLMMRELTGGSVEKWLDIELPKVQNLRMDLLGETGEGSLIHIELQSGNDAAMPLRMAEYCLGVYRLFD